MSAGCGKAQKKIKGKRTSPALRKSSFTRCQVTSPGRPVTLHDLALRNFCSSRSSRTMMKRPSSSLSLSVSMAGRVRK